MATSAPGTEPRGRSRHPRHIFFENLLTQHSPSHTSIPAQTPQTVVVDQGAIRGSRRSSPLTFTGLLDPIRRLFAAASGAPAATFSPNSDGACPACQGAGVIFTDLAFMEGVTTTCEQCQGRRFNPEAQRHTLRGRSIADVFEMTVPDALEFFHEPPVTGTLERLADVGQADGAIGVSE